MVTNRTIVRKAQIMGGRTSETRRLAGFRDSGVALRFQRYLEWHPELKVTTGQSGDSQDREYCKSRAAWARDLTLSLVAWDYRGTPRPETTESPDANANLHEGETTGLVS